MEFRSASSASASPLLALVASGLLLAIAERLRPCRGGFSARRWIANLGLYGSGIALVSGALMAAGVSVGNPASRVSLGLGVVSIVLLDFCQYLVHRAQRGSRLLWRAHRAHPTDHGVDVSTAFRFHPLETGLRTPVTLMIVALLGVPLALTLLYASCGHIIDDFAHADLELPRPLERALRWVFVTPDMHRIHHSARANEQEANLGAMLSVWDRLFGTDLGSAAEPPAQRRFGVASGALERQCRLGWLLPDPALDESGQPPRRRDLRA